jgi:hypothetical protein
MPIRMMLKKSVGVLIALTMSHAISSPTSPSPTIDRSPGRRRLRGGAARAGGEAVGASAAISGF